MPKQAGEEKVSVGGRERSDLMPEVFPVAYPKSYMGAEEELRIALRGEGKRKIILMYCCDAICITFGQSAIVQLCYYLACDISRAGSTPPQTWKSTLLLHFFSVAVQNQCHWLLTLIRQRGFSLLAVMSPDSKRQMSPAKGHLVHRDMSLLRASFSSLENPKPKIPN